MGLAVEQYPSITPPNIQVSASYQGGDALSTDEAVATPLLDAIVGVDDMLYIESTSSSSGDMTINVTFDIGSDPDLDAIFVQNNAATATSLLPTSVQEQGVVTTKSSSDFLMVYSLFSDGRYDGLFLENYAHINILNELLKINGVGNVQIMGSGPYSMRIWISPDKLKYYNVTLSDITTAIEAQSGVHPSGKLGAMPYASTTEFTYTVTLPSPISSAQQYENIVLRTLTDGGTLYLRDVARVELGAESYGAISSFNGDPAVVIAVFQAPGSNAMEVGTTVDNTMRELSERFYDGIDYYSIINAPEPIKKGIRDIIITLILALVLVIGIVYLFLQDLRAMVVPLVAIPVSLVGAFMLFPVVGVSINVFSLLGLILAIGLVVDDAIVVVEAVQLNIASGKRPREATLEAMRSVSSPIIATSLSLSAVFIPVAYISGITGELFRQFAFTIALSVVISAFNALTLSPALCSLILRRKEREFGGFNRWFNRTTERYLSFTSVLARHASRAALFVIIVGAGLFFTLRELPSGLLPTEDEGYFMIALQLPDAASVERTYSVAEEVREIIAANPAVESVACLAGFDMLAQVSSTNCGLIFVKLKDYSLRKASAAELVELFNGELYMAVGGGIAFAFQPPAIPGLGTASGISLMVQDRGGNSIDYLSSHTDNFIAKAQKLPQIASLTSTFSDKVPQRMVKVNTQKAIHDGVDITELNALIGTYLGGTYINNFNRFGQIYETYIQSEGAYRESKENLESYFIENSSGIQVPLSSFVEVIDTLGVEYIQQFNLYRSIALNANLKSGYSSSEGMAALEELAAEVLPRDMTVAWSGVSLIEKGSEGGGAIAFTIALIFVFLILASLYESWVLPLAILTGVPIAALGAALLSLCAHIFIPAITSNIFMQISLVLLIGLSAKNAILIVEYANGEFFERGKSLVEATLSAARLRLRPIIMTALAFLLGVSPLAFAGGPTEVAQKTLGIALIGGTIFSTLFGIFLYPLLYLLFAKIGRFEKLRQKRNRNNENL